MKWTLEGISALLQVNMEVREVANLLTPLFSQPILGDDEEERLVRSLERIGALLVLHTVLITVGVSIVMTLLVIHLAG